MGVLLSTLGIQEPKLTLRPVKVVVGTLHGTQITLAYLMNVILSVIAVVMIVLLEYGFIPAVKQGFFCDDPSISHKYNGDTITPVLLGVSAAVLPIVMVISTELLAHQSFRQLNYYAIVFYVSECLVGATLTLLVTSVAKVIVGEHRPHFFDTCRPDTAINCTAGQFIETYTCTSTEYSDPFMFDSSLSFPSGHSSISWFVAIFTTYIVHSRTTTVNSGYIAKPFLISICLTYSLLCSLSRITDRRHHWWDVLSGSIIGIIFAIYAIKVTHDKLKDHTSHVCSICLESRLSYAGPQQNGIDI